VPRMTRQRQRMVGRKVSQEENNCDDHHMADLPDKEKLSLNIGTSANFLSSNREAYIRALKVTLIRMPRRHACIFAFLFDFISILFNFSDPISFIFAYISFIRSLLVVFHTVASPHDRLTCISHSPNP
jgi:hypothetical protein